MAKVAQPKYEGHVEACEVALTALIRRMRTIGCSTDRIKDVVVRAARSGLGRP